MTLVQKASLLSALAIPTFLFAADTRTAVPDNVILCGPASGCTTETIFGRTYQVLTTPHFTVKVALSHEGPYTRADVSIANNTDYSLYLSPEDFRVEVLAKKPKVLLYVPPSDLKDVLPPQPIPAPAIPAPAAPPPIPASSAEAPAAAPVADAPTTAQAFTTNIDESSPAAKNDVSLQEAAEIAAIEKNLSSASLPPNEVTRGRVYFERDNGKKAERVNVVLPIAGVVFEFPYIMER
jgi:hypothetical protein